MILKCHILSVETSNGSHNWPNRNWRHPMASLLHAHFQMFNWKHIRLATVFLPSNIKRYINIYTTPCYRSIFDIRTTAVSKGMNNTDKKYRVRNSFNRGPAEGLQSFHNQVSITRIGYQCFSKYTILCFSCTGGIFFPVSSLPRFLPWLSIPTINHLRIGNYNQTVLELTNEQEKLRILYISAVRIHIARSSASARANITDRL